MKVTGKLLKFCSTLFSLAIVLAFLPLLPHNTASAASAGYAITPVYPTNQVGAERGFFNLVVKPGTQQQVSVKLVNMEDKDRTIQFQLNTASTSDAGSLVYTLQKSKIPKDNTIEKYISDFVPKPSVQNVKIKAKTAGYVNFLLDIPKSGWKGYVLGGIFATPVGENTQTTTVKGTLLKQQFGLTIPVAMRTDANYAGPLKLRLNAIRPKMLPGDKNLGVAINTQNVNPAYTQGDLNIDARISRKGSKTVIHSKKVSGTSFAPNSNYDFGVSWDGKPLEPGKYHLSWKSNIGGVQNWNFERDFTISNADAQRLNNQAGFKPNYLWLWIILAILLVVLIIVIAYYYGRKKNQRNNNPQKTTRS